MVSDLTFITPMDEHREAVRQLVRAFVAVWPGSDFGPAHIALSDYNLLEDHLQFCRSLVVNLIIGIATPEQRDTYRDHDLTELNATLAFLEMLWQIPEEWRDIHTETVEDDA